MIKNLRLFFIFLFLSSCGYTPIYQIDQELDFKLDTIYFSGDKKISRKIEQGLEKFKITIQKIFLMLILLLRKKKK